MQVKTKIKKSKEMFVKSIKKLTKHEHFYSQLRDFLTDDHCKVDLSYGILLHFEVKIRYWLI